MLTPHQQEKHDEVIKLLREGHNRILLLGDAGVGKTYLAGELVKSLRRDRTVNTHYNNGSVYVTAPTNKALAVLKTKVHESVEFATIHSALKLKRNINKRTGKATFIKAWSKTDNFRNCKLAFIDETSMLNTPIEGGYDAENNYQRGYLDDYNFPIIYLGDDKQINPVGEPFSPVFHKGYPIVRLTEIVRQKHGNPIIDLSRDIDMIFFMTPQITSEGKGYMYNDNKDDIIEMLAEVNGTDEVKYLAFTNDAVDGMNTIVRQKIYGSPNKIEKNETIVFNAPMGEFYTNKEVKIEGFDLVTQDVPVPKHSTKFDKEGLPYNGLDTIKMKFYHCNGAFNVVHEQSEEIYKDIVKQLTYNCAKLGWDWRGKYYFEEMFAAIKYNHAITVHKSQGSTYKTSIINVGNIMFNKNAEERQRLLYTAVTRASDLIMLNNVK